MTRREFADIEYAGEVRGRDGGARPLGPPLGVVYAHCQVCGQTGTVGLPCNECGTVREPDGPLSGQRALALLAERRH